MPVRTIALKIVRREGELTNIGLEPGYVSEELKIENIRNLLQSYSVVLPQALIFRATRPGVLKLVRVGSKRELFGVGQVA